LCGLLGRGRGSEFLTELNLIGDLVEVQAGGGPFGTVLSTVNDEVVTPYQSQCLAGPFDLQFQPACLS
jgi:triacylglycerol lipase